ncbi:hypothetical protein HanPI659440_Chr11g0442501 [Helianthus annuus]|nr:hypothetical protein HanPI659440_Chr11g0442501 [Helianthus annuus]
MLKIHKQTIDKRNDGKMETNSHPQTNYLGSSCPVTVSRRWVDSEHAMAEVDNVEDDDDLWKKLWWLPNMLSRKKCLQELFCKDQWQALKFRIV